MGETSAPLKVSLVHEAIQRALDAIYLLRAQTLNTIVRSKIGTKKYEGKSHEEIEKSLPDEEAMIPQMIQKEFELRLLQIDELASVVAAENPDLRMDVSLADFQLIKKHYGKRADSHEQKKVRGS